MHQSDGRETLRKFSCEKHKSNSWQSRMPVSLVQFKPFINFVSFKHAGISRLASYCRPDFKVMDFGSGTGTYSSYFYAQCQCTVFTVDWSFEALRKIKKSHNKNKIAICADLHKLPFKSGVVDALFTIDTLGHLSNQSLAFSEMRRILDDGAPVFLHSECSDYKVRWPDRVLIKKNGTDIPADADGHVSLRTSAQIIGECLKHFNCVNWFSPAGLLGWMMGYPEKYVTAFESAGLKIPCWITKFMKSIKSSGIPGRSCIRLINAISNHVELFLGLNGGGSVFVDLVKPPTPCKDLSIDIIIPTLNRKKDLCQLLVKLIPQCTHNDKIIIVSQDQIPPPIPHSDKVSIIYSSPANLPLARNRGILASSNEIILFLDDDVIPDEHLLEQHRKIFSDKKIDCTAGFIHDDRFVTTSKSPSEFDFRSGKCIQNFSFPSMCSSISFMGAHFAFRRSTIADKILFDPQFKGNAYWEDIDFSFRLLKNGYSITFNPETVVTHNYRSSGGCRSSSSAKYLYDYFSNATYFSMKYMPYKYLSSWFHYWKYRLEYEVRSRNPAIFKHDPVLLLCGCAGFAGGFIRFLFRGKRIGLPLPVIKHWNSLHHGPEQ